eukprot:8301370-Lingulodinium_polyedra.AAC.1
MRPIRGPHAALAVSSLAQQGLMAPGVRPDACRPLVVPLRVLSFLGCPPPRESARGSLPAFSTAGLQGVLPDGDPPSPRGPRALVLLVFVVLRVLTAR